MEELEKVVRRRGLRTSKRRKRKGLSQRGYRVNNGDLRRKGSVKMKRKKRSEAEEGK